MLLVTPRLHCKVTEGGLTSRRLYMITTRCSASRTSDAQSDHLTNAWHADQCTSEVSAKCVCIFDRPATWFCDSRIIDKLHSHTAASYCTFATVQHESILALPHCTLQLQLLQVPDSFWPCLPLPPNTCDTDAGQLTASSWATRLLRPWDLCSLPPPLTR